MNNYLSHHGVKGQKWGVRRFQNADGSLTPDGKKRYGQMFDAFDKTSKLVEKKNKLDKELYDYRKSHGYTGKNGMDEYAFDKQMMNKDADFKKKRYETMRLSTMIGNLNDTSYKELEKATIDLGREAVSEMINNYNNYKSKHN